MATKLHLESESTLTDRYQTTIPEMVRKALKLDKRDKIRYTIQANQVIISRIEQDEEDPILGQFLSFIAHDIHENPHNIKTINSDLVPYVQSLLRDVEFDFEIPLSPEDE